MLENISKLPLDSYDAFISDSRNPASAESFLRRALEALMDTGRHILAKGYAIDVTDYKSIALKLNEMQVIDSDAAAVMRILAGYRNRMVHFYIEISRKELFDICSEKLEDVNKVLNSIIKWIEANPEKIDKQL
jgi:uncharacterized protein YutE (UPF0331/DUF86 family)